MLLPLFMASRNPHSPTTSNYIDMEVKATEIDNPDSEYRKINFNIRNIGNGYILANDNIICYAFENADHIYIRSSVSNELMGTNVIIAPNNEFSFTLTTSSNIDFTKAYYRASAYIEASRYITYSGTNEITKEDYRTYIIDTTASGMRDRSKFEYVFVATMEYEENVYSFVCSENLTEDSKLRFYVQNEDFDESKAVIKNIIGFEYDVYNPNYAGYALGGALYILVMSIPIIIGIFLFFVLPGIILLVVFKKKRKNQQNL